MMRPYTSLCSALIMLCVAGSARSDVGEDPVAAVLKLEADLHAACDKWEAAMAAGNDTTALEDEISNVYRELLRLCMDNNIGHNNAILVPDEFAWAGKLVLQDRTEFSCMIGKGQSGLVVSVWHRNAREGRLSPHGIDGSIGIKSRQLEDAFSVAPASWTDPEKKVMRVPYAFGEIKGTIEVRRDGDEWVILPDRGKLDGAWWDPFAK